jgi:hypothetical protein
MPLPLIVAGAAAGGSMLSGFMNARSSKEAAERQEEMFEQMRRTLNISADEIQGFSNEYVGFLDQLDRTFDPYDMDAAFDSLYEAVIQPMERDFDENVLPGIQAAYGGGVMGGGAGLSGARAETEAKARRDVSEKKASLRFQEREGAIARNFAEFDRRAGVGQLKLAAQSSAPLMRAGYAGQTFQAGTDTIASRLASDQARAGILPGSISAAIGGYTSGASVAGNLALNKYIKSQTPKEEQ